MARYWQAKTFTGFYVEGRNQERQVAQQLSDALGGSKTEEIMGAGIYVWLAKALDPELRVKDLGDRTLIEVIVVDRSVIKKKKKAKAVPAAAEGEEEGEAAAPAAPPEPGPVEALLAKVDGVLGGIYTRVDDTPDQLKTRLDLRLAKWKKPRPMVIASGVATGGGLASGEHERGRGGGGVGALIAMIFAAIVVGGAGYYFITSASNDPFYVYMPGSQYAREPTALGFLEDETGRLVVINVPTRLDTMWGNSPRFVRAITDTVSTLSFEAKTMTDLRVNKQRMPSVILEPSGEAQESTANELDVAALVWNRAEVWQDWFETEINRALVRGTLYREEGNLYLRAGENVVGLELSDLLNDEQRLLLRYAENRDKTVLMEVRFQETYPLRRVRTRQSRKLFSAEVRSVRVLYEESGAQ